MILFRPAEDTKYRAPDWMGIPEGTDLSGQSRPDPEYVPAGEPANLGDVIDQDVQLLEDGENRRYHLSIVIFSYLIIFQTYSR